MTIEHAPRLAYTDDSHIEPAPRQHVDDMAVDTLAAQQKARLAEKRGQGFNGWDDPRRCSLEKLSMLMAQSMCKGKVVDVANFAAMLYSRGAAPELVGEHAMRSLLRGAREHRASVASQLRTILADDSHAFTFQTMGQYRTALLKAFDNVATAEEPTPQACAHCGGSGRQEDVFEQSRPICSTEIRGLPETLIAKLIEQHDPCGQSQRTYEFARAIERESLSQGAASAQQAQPEDDSGAIASRVEWDKFPAWLIDHHEGDTITEELLQRALADMLNVHTPATPAEYPCMSCADCVEGSPHMCPYKGPTQASVSGEQPAEEVRGVDSSRIDLIARAIVDGYKEQYAVTSEQADALRDCIASELEFLAAGTGQPIHVEAYREQQMIDHEAVACPHCGGSGHKDDVKPPTGAHALSEVRAALLAARQFIKNGVEFGYITMPDANCPDTAHETLPAIEAAIATLGGAASEPRAVGLEAYSYQQLFSAIAAATQVSAGYVAISVETFRAALAASKKEA